MEIMYIYSQENLGYNLFLHPKKSVWETYQPYRGIKVSPEYSARAGPDSTNKPQLDAHHHSEIAYDGKVQYSKDVYGSKVLDVSGITWVQSILGALLFYAREVDNKLLIELRTIVFQQAVATQETIKQPSRIYTMSQHI